MHVYAVTQKSKTLERNFGKCRLIFKILSLLSVTAAPLAPTAVLHGELI